MTIQLRVRWIVRERDERNEIQHMKTVWHLRSFLQLPISVGICPVTKELIICNNSVF